MGGGGGDAAGALRARAAPVSPLRPAAGLPARRPRGRPAPPRTGRRESPGGRRQRSPPPPQRTPPVTVPPLVPFAAAVSPLSRAAALGPSRGLPSARPSTAGAEGSRQELCVGPGEGSGGAQLSTWWYNLSAPGRQRFRWSTKPSVLHVRCFCSQVTAIFQRRQQDEGGRHHPSSLGTRVEAGWPQINCGKTENTLQYVPCVISHHWGAKGGKRLSHWRKEWRRPAQRRKPEAAGLEQPVWDGPLHTHRPEQFLLTVTG